MARPVDVGGPLGGPKMSNRTRLALANSQEFAASLSPAESAVLATVLATLSAATVAGNALVLLSFLLDRRLRTHTNAFLLSLATSDLLVGAVSMPVFSHYLLRGEWTLGRVLCDLWLCQDYVCGQASCLNLVLIGMDRYLSVTRPLRYRARRTGRQVALLIGGVWFTSFLLWPPWIWAWQYIEGRRTVPDDDCYVQFLETNFYLTMVTSVLDYYLPLAIMLLLYYGIWRETRNRERYLAVLEAERHCIEDSRSVPRTSRSTHKGFLWFLAIFDHTSNKVSSGATMDGVSCSLWPVEAMPLHLSEDNTQHSYHSSMNDKTDGELDETASEAISSKEVSFAGKTEHVPSVEVSSSRKNEAVSSEKVHSSRRTEPVPNVKVSSSRSTEAVPTVEVYFSRKTETAPIREVSSSRRTEASASEGVSTPSKTYIRSDDPTLVPLRHNAYEKTAFSDDEPHSCAKDNKTNNTAYHMIKTIPVVDNSSSCDKVTHVSKKHLGALRGDHKAARVLTVILLAFIVTTTPYNIIVIINNLDSTHSLVPDTVWYFVYFLYYVNSTLNPVCYALGNQNFKRTYWKILTCSWNRREACKASFSLRPDSKSLQLNKTCTTPL